MPLSAPRIQTRPRACGQRLRHSAGGGVATIARSLRHIHTSIEYAIADVEALQSMQAAFKKQPPSNGGGIVSDTATVPSIAMFIAAVYVNPSGSPSKTRYSLQV
jgi:hypothetical protein